MDLSQIENALLNKELIEIEDALKKIKTALVGVFSKYGKLEGDFANELTAYLNSAFRGETAYFAGYTTAPAVNTSKVKIPEPLKKAVLKWAIADFLEQVESIAELSENF